MLLGADFVMAGGLFAGHDQSGGEIIEKNGRVRFFLLRKHEIASRNTNCSME